MYIKDLSKGRSFFVRKIGGEMMIFENVETKYVEETVEIAIKEYEAECLKCPQLIKKDIRNEVRGLLTVLFENGFGKVAIDEGKVIGYLAFWKPWDEFMGKVRGAFSPLGGSGFSGNNRNKLASKLFEQVSGEQIKNNICAYAVSRYAHDEEVGKSFVLNGFGIRCSDAMLKLSERAFPQNETLEIICKEANEEERKQIIELQKGLTKHLSKAPIFFPTNLEHFFGEEASKGGRVFIAKHKDEVIGFIKVVTEGETFLTNDSSMYSLGPTFVREDYREQKVAEKLLEYICKIAEAEGKTYLGVDYETLNPNALRFFWKYFESYTYSYFRRVDERVVNYDTYMNVFFNK